MEWAVLTTRTNHQRLLCSLSVNAYIAWVLLAAFTSASALASNDNLAQKETNHLSFYAPRSVFIGETSIEQPRFLQRAIAPPIDKLSMSAQLQALEEDPKTSTSTTSPKQKPLVTLSRNERLLAKKSAHYFKYNWREQTGLWDSVQGYPYTTMWDIASGIAATLAMEALNMETTEQTRRILGKTLTTLSRLKLYKDILPNREYSSKTGEPAGRYSTLTTNGNGWSALDIGRLLIWLKIMEQYHPELKAKVQSLIRSWKLEKAINQGTLFGTKFTGKKEHYRQEGRHGYLEYASQGFSLFEFEVKHPRLSEYLNTVLINDVAVTTDSRNVPFLTSDPLVLAAIEFGENKEWNQVKAVYQLHQQEWQKTNTLIAYAEDSMNRAPWFAYNNIYYQQQAWLSVSPSGKRIDNPQTFSNKVAIAFSILFDSSYSDALFHHALKSSLPYRSIPTGYYEDGGLNTAFNSNTNSLILVSLWYKQRGRRPILEPSTDSDKQIKP